MSMKFVIPNGQTVSDKMSWDFDGASVSFLFYDGSGLPATVTGIPKVYRSLYDAGEGWQIVNPISHGEWRFNGPASRVKVDLTGVTGYSAYQVVIWRTDDPMPLIPDGAFTGMRAEVFQNFTEANVKNGVQYEAASQSLAVADNGTIDTIFITGALPVVIKSRIVQFNGVRLETRVYRAPTYTGGSSVPYFNLNDVEPVTGGVTIIGGATVTAAGTEFGAPTFNLGSSNIGNVSVSTYSTFGIERKLRPNTTYLQRIINTSGAAQDITGYLSWFEGQTDLPIRAQ